VAYLVGTDIGGTFTDAVVFDLDKGTVTSAKALSTAPNYEEGCINSLEVAAEQLSLTLHQLLEQTKAFVFGTTVATNTILTGSGVKTGYITTKGFEDVLHMARGTSKWVGLPFVDTRHVAATRKPDFFIPKELIVGIIERIDRDGEIIIPINSDKTKEDVNKFFDKGLESIAVCLLWSPRNNTHEKYIYEIIREMFPGIYVSLSSEIAPVVGEYERGITTALDAYVGPVTQRSLQSLYRRLQESGFGGEARVMKAEGGSTFITETKPIATTQSGPVGGAVAASYMGRLLGIKNIISADVGGTTFDVSLIWNGELMYSREPYIGRFLVAYPAIDITSIGAGGGSVAWVEPEVKSLHVGPKSAGAYPGPICYGFGGTEPTVTDACLILGYLNPEYFLGGRMRLDYEAAAEGVKRLGAQLGMNMAEMALGIWRIINAEMQELLRGVTIRRGYNPADFDLLAFGGAGPMHATEYGFALGVKRVIVPAGAATESALGLASSDAVHTIMLPGYYLLPMDPVEFNSYFDKLEQRAHANLDRERVAENDREIRYFLDMRYGLQYHVHRVSIPRKKYTHKDMDLLASEFDRVYEASYGKGAGFSAAGRYITNFVVQGIGRTIAPVLPKLERGTPDASAALKGKRKALFTESGKYAETRVYDYFRLRSGNTLEGPSVIEAPHTTLVIHGGQKIEVDDYGNIIIMPA
jgi:N-methylhydantoinase A